MSKELTAEELTNQFVFWNPEIIFVEHNGYKLALEIDAFNEHMYWYVEWIDLSDGREHSKEFTDFNAARDYFLEVIK